MSWERANRAIARGCVSGSAAASEQTSATTERRVSGSVMERNASFSATSSEFRSHRRAVGHAAEVPVREPLEEILHRHVEEIGDQVEPPGADAVRALLVLLHLAEGQSQVPAQGPLADPEGLTKVPCPLPDMHIDFIGRHDFHFILLVGCSTLLGF